MEKELKLGFMSTNELAEWSSRKETTISKGKGKWCERFLSSHAKYNLIRGGVEILEIYDPIFSKSGKEEIHSKYLDYYGNENNKIDNCKNCFKKMKRANAVKAQISDDTYYNYICASKREDYGVPKKYHGSKGFARWRFVKIMPNGEAEEFTDEEREIKSELEDKYLKTNKQLIYEAQAIITGRKEKEYSQEECDTMLEELLTTETGWNVFRRELEKAVGCRVDYRQELKDDEIIKKGYFCFGEGVDYFY